MYEEDDFYTDLIVCGRNCEKLILDIAEKKNIKCSLSGYDIHCGHSMGTAQLEELC